MGAVFQNELLMGEEHVLGGKLPESSLPLDALAQFEPEGEAVGFQVPFRCKLGDESACLCVNANEVLINGAHLEGPRLASHSRDVECRG